MQLQSPQELTIEQVDQVSGGGKLDAIGTCKADPKPENSAFGGAMVALAIILLL